MRLGAIVFDSNVLIVKWILDDAIIIMMEYIKFNTNLECL